MSQAAGPPPDGAHRRHHDGTSQTILGWREVARLAGIQQLAVGMGRADLRGGGRGHGPRRRSVQRDGPRIKFNNYWARHTPPAPNSSSPKLVHLLNYGISIQTMQPCSRLPAAKWCRIITNTSLARFILTARVDLRLYVSHLVPHGCLTRCITVEYNPWHANVRLKYHACSIMRRKIQKPPSLGAFGPEMGGNGQNGAFLHSSLPLAEINLYNNIPDGVNT